MLNDIAQVWWALIIAYTAHQIVWLVLHLVFANLFRGNIGWSLLPDLLATFGSVNLFLVMIHAWGIVMPDSLYAVLIYAAVVNMHAFVRYVQSQRGNARRLQVYWLVGLNLGFGLFGLEQLLMRLL